MKRIKRTPAEKARAQYTGYLVKEPMELMDFLAAKMPDASRTKLKSLLSKRIVLVDNVITTQFNFPLQPGMKVLISKDKNKKEFRHPLLKIVYEDAYIIVVEKKEGLLSVGTERQKERTAQHILSEYVGRSGRGNRIYVVHRLDRDTSGLTIVSKHLVSGSILSDMTKYREVHREYLAIARGSVTPSEGTIQAPLGRKGGTIIERTVDWEHGEDAVTHYKVVKEANGHSLVSLRLETGRTHQIRIHMKYLGYPLIGDYLYNPDMEYMTRQALHSHHMEFTHPITGEHMSFTAPLPEDMARVM